MALPMLKAELKIQVQSMLDEGLLDGQFTELQALQDKTNPNFVSEVITLFLKDGQMILIEMIQLTARQDVDFSILNIYLHKLKGSSSSIGARQMTLACADLRLACDAQNKERVRREYFNLQLKLKILVQLEKTIFAIETR
ncbi:hypothetical protein UlMin_005582 [Ulmus minor]